MYEVGYHGADLIGARTKTLTVIAHALGKRVWFAPVVFDERGKVLHLLWV
jgi:hypothetical protein